METARRPFRPLMTGAAVLFLVAAVAGCTGRNGSIRYDAGVGLRFGSAQILPGYRYYTTGSETAPDAILALRDNCPLRGDGWREVPMTPEKLTLLVDRMRGTRDSSPLGSVILDEKGNQIGVMCSYRKPPSVQLLDDGGVIVSPPFEDLGDSPRSHGFGRD